MQHEGTLGVQGVRERLEKVPIDRQQTPFWEKVRRRDA